jgi:predicted DNA-binding transcriptional regulator AlpA
MIAEECLSLNAQTKALGVNRSTAWTMMKAKHKLDRLALKTTDSMLANPQLPPPVRIVVL